MASNTVKPLDAVIGELKIQTADVLKRVKGDATAAKLAVDKYVEDMRATLGVALDTVVEFPNEETHQRTLAAIVNAVWNRTLREEEQFSVAQRYELRMGLFAAVRVVVQVLAGVPLAVA